MSIKARRSGLTSTVWNQSNISVDLRKGHECFRLALDLNSKGGGVTQVEILVGEDSFKAIALAMMETNPVKASKAFGKALQKINLSS